MNCIVVPLFRFVFVAFTVAFTVVVPGLVPAAVMARQDESGPSSETAGQDELSRAAIGILREHCFECHGGGERIRAELVLTNRHSLLAGGDSGPAVDLQAPDDSLLLEALNYESYEMPPEGKLPAEDIELIRRWIAAGARWSGESLEAPADAGHSGVPEVNAETRKWWSWQPLQRPQVPPLDDAFVRNDIDRFVLQRLQEAGLQPNPPASRRELIRRASYDLTGLPPTREEVEQFVNDRSPAAWEKVIDRLLDSPHYGEKWGRHWLDLVRYAESNSYERDGTKPWVWRYRDYVIDAFNNDMPYDRFLMEQLAGDEMDDVTPQRIVATGYYRLGRWDDEPADPLQAWYDDMDDVLATTSQAMLGLTINCARCHDHKIDPVPQADYYRLLAFFRNVRRYGVRSDDTVRDASVRVIASEEAQTRHRAACEAWETAVRENREALEAIEALVKDDFEPVEHEEFRDEMKRVALVDRRRGDVIDEEQADEYARLFETMRQLRNARPAGLESALCVKETGPQPAETFVLIRGNPHAPADRVEPGFPEVLGVPDPEIRVPPEGISSGRRLALARWIASPDNPLTPRVMANRLWQYHFGRGIVRSSSDFGFQGTPPTHPELLDWLASELIAGQWKMKRIHRLIMTSGVWQMSSRDNPQARAADPLNDLFWRYDMRRLTAEEIRDSILFVNGVLNLDESGGPSIYPVLPGEVLQGQSMPGANWHTSSGQDLDRRSVYIHIKRSLPVPLLASFDAADPDSPCPVRFNTVQPTQALGMINSDFIRNQAGRFADDLQRAAPDDLEAQVGQALNRVLQRQPEAHEIERGTGFVQSLRDQGIGPQESLQHFCLLALNLNEFLFVD